VEKGDPAFIRLRGNPKEEKNVIIAEDSGKIILGENITPLF